LLQVSPSLYDHYFGASIDEYTETVPLKDSAVTNGSVSTTDMYKVMSKLYDEAMTDALSHTSITTTTTTSTTSGGMITSPVASPAYRTTAAKFDTWDQSSSLVTKEDLNSSLETMKEEIIAQVCDFLEKWLDEREDAR